MYEPKFLPPLKDDYITIQNFRFAMKYSDEYQYHNDPEAESVHLHNCLEIFVNISSDISFFVNNNLYSVPVGDAVVSMPNDIHGGIFNTSGVHEFICIWIDAQLESPLFSFLRHDCFHPLFSFSHENKELLHSLAFKLWDASSKNHSELEKMSLLFQILMMFQEENTHHTERTVIPDTLQKILDNINENFPTIHSVNDILKDHFISSATLTRWFRRYLGTTPKEYLKSIRLSDAALLLSKGVSVTDACFQSGFSDCSHFIVLFKKKFLTTPLKYKKSKTSDDL